MMIKSEILNREVIADIYMNAPARSPMEVSLLLINDGQDVEKFDLAYMLESMATGGTLSPLWCVAIHAGQERKMEYGIAGIPDYKGRGLFAQRYSDFIFEELLPRIRSLGSGVFKEMAFAGFSLGALSALDIVWNHPRIFRKAGLFSGSFWWRLRDKDDPAYRDDSDRIIHRRIREGHYQPGLKFFFECGTADETEDRNSNGVIDSIDDTQDLIRELDAKGYEPGRDIFYLEIEGGKHDVATWARAMPVFLEWGWGK